MELKEQVQGVEASGHRAQVFYKRRETWQSKILKKCTELVTYNSTDNVNSKKVTEPSPNIQSSRHSRQITSSCHTCSRPCWAVGSRQPWASSWKNFCRLNTPITKLGKQREANHCVFTAAKMAYEVPVFACMIKPKYHLPCALHLHAHMRVNMHS